MSGRHILILSAPLRPRVTVLHVPLGGLTAAGYVWPRSSHTGTLMSAVAKAGLTKSPVREVASYRKASPTGIRDANENE